MSFWCLQFSQKMNENNLTWGIIVVKSNFSFVFWENWRYYQKDISKLTDLYHPWVGFLLSFINLRLYTVWIPLGPVFISHSFINFSFTPEANFLSTYIKSRRYKTTRWILCQIRKCVCLSIFQSPFRLDSFIGSLASSMAGKMNLSKVLTGQFSISHR